MKKLIIIFLFFTGSLFAQGTLNTPYDTTGWDPPATYTQWYGLRIFTLLSNPGGGYNRNTRDIDSLMYELVVYTDTNQLAISNDTLVFANSMSGISTFSTTDQYDTVLISGLLPTDVVVVSARETVPGANDILSAKCLADTLICQRPAAGTSGLKWNWIWVKK